jgi:hypothetical protein
VRSTSFGHASAIREAGVVRNLRHPGSLPDVEDRSTAAWLGTSTWPAYGAAGVTAAYGILKAYWVFGGTALWSIAPLDPEMIDKARSGTAPRWFEIADAVSVGLAVAGGALAVATVSPRRWLPARLVRWALLPLAVFMVLRALLSIPGDVYEIASGGELTDTALWDLALWSPLFLIWGLLWAATALTYTERSRRSDPRSPAAGSAPRIGEPAEHRPRTRRAGAGRG